MSHEVLSRVIERASTDGSFRSRLASDPESALAGYDLTSEERAAVTSGHAAGLGSIGVDARVSKLDNHAGPGEYTDTQFN